DGRRRDRPPHRGRARSPWAGRPARRPTAAGGPALAAPRRPPAAGPPALTRTGPGPLWGRRLRPTRRGERRGAAGGRATRARGAAAGLRAARPVAGLPARDGGGRGADRPEPGRQHGPWHGGRLGSHERARARGGRAPARRRPGGSVDHGPSGHGAPDPARAALDGPDLPPALRAARPGHRRSGRRLAPLRDGRARRARRLPPAARGGHRRSARSARRPRGADRPGRRPPARRGARSRGRRTAHGDVPDRRRRRRRDAHPRTRLLHGRGAADHRRESDRRAGGARRRRRDDLDGPAPRRPQGATRDQRHRDRATGPAGVGAL
ncbi:MAG: hypothetical protein AVDCRST_MAG79-1932, partial [uncultured Thermoleophilia bacterium]